MSETSKNGASLLDPFGFWKTARDANLEALSKMMVDVVNSDEYARTTGAALEQLLATSQPFRDALERTMTQTLAMMNMPSRAEVISIAERLVNIEMRLDDLDAKLSDIHESLRDSFEATVGKALAAHAPAPALAPDTKALETRLEKMNNRLDALLDAIGNVQTPKTPKTPAKPNAEKA